ncbi:hypothetical protein [Winogradskyella sediminis]|uniref:hypothetical protein n=1 Tax=Winogradskyella sediminis TaxID=1382466 RepID=UPI003AA803EC
MKAENNNTQPTKYRTAIDIVNQTYDFLDMGKARLKDIENGDTEYLINLYHETIGHISKVLEEAKPNEFTFSDREEVIDLFKELVYIINELKPQLNEEDYKEFRKFYRDVNSELGTVKSTIAIEPNPLRESLLKILNEHLIDNTLNSKIIVNENESWFKVGVQFANGKIIELFDEGKNKSEISKELFGSTSYRIMIGQTYENKNDPVKNLFKRRRAKKEIEQVIKYCIKNRIPIKEQKFIEYERRLRLKSKS